MAKVLLVVDVDHLGRSGDIVNVKPGFARNFLLPRKLALVANERAVRMQADLQAKRQEKAIEDKRESETLAGKLSEVNVSINVKTDHEGHMYGSVSVLDIIHLLKEQAGIELEKKYVQLKHPIKAIGLHTIPLKLKEGVQSAVILNIIPEGSKLAQ